MKRRFQLITCALCWITVLAFVSLLFQNSKFSIPGKQTKYSLKQEVYTGSIYLEEEENEQQHKTKLDHSTPAVSFSFPSELSCVSALFLNQSKAKPALYNLIYLRNRNFRI